jgi:hypothetical protein
VTVSAEAVYYGKSDSTLPNTSSHINYNISFYIPAQYIYQHAGLWFPAGARVFRASSRGVQPVPRHRAPSV